MSQLRARASEFRALYPMHFTFRMMKKHIDGEKHRIGGSIHSKVTFTIYTNFDTLHCPKFVILGLRTLKMLYVGMLRK